MSGPDKKSPVSEVDENGSSPEALLDVEIASFRAKVLDTIAGGSEEFQARVLESIRLKLRVLGNGANIQMQTIQAREKIDEELLQEFMTYAKKKMDRQGKSFRTHLYSGFVSRILSSVYDAKGGNITWEDVRNYVVEFGLSKPGPVGEMFIEFLVSKSLINELHSIYTPVPTVYDLRLDSSDPLLDKPIDEALMATVAESKFSRSYKTYIDNNLDRMRRYKSGDEPLTNRDLVCRLLYSNIYPISETPSGNEKTGDIIATYLSHLGLYGISEVRVVKNSEASPAHAG